MICEEKLEYTFLVLSPSKVNNVSWSTAIKAQQNFIFCLSNILWIIDYITFSALAIAMYGTGVEHFLVYTPPVPNLGV